jgi:hypothetical protein
LRRFGSDTVLHLASFSADGVAQSEQRIAAGAFWDCAVAQQADVTALVVTIENPKSRDYAIAAYFVDAAGVHGPLELRPHEPRMPWLDVVSDPAGGWAIAYATDDGVQLVRFDRGGVREVKSLDGVDGDTMSLGATGADLFVSWHERGKIRLRNIAGDRTRTVGRASRTQTAAVGVGTDCAVAWSNGRDKYAFMSLVACP